jgi:CRISPR-associated protein (TIGR02710 family)
MTRVLILSVGGSVPPLRTAIEARPWDRVVFVVSDGSDGTRSSRTQVEDAEIGYDSRTGTRGPGLRHLPACPRDIAIVPVPPDDLDRALALTDAALARELANGAQVTVNYTGGTKTMTAAMVLAGAAHEDSRLEFMAGRREGLDTVVAGTEAPVEMPGHLLGAANLFALARAQVHRRAYGAALAILSEVGQRFAAADGSGLPRAPKSWRKRAEDWRAWLTVFDAWDRFDVRAALDALGHGLARGAGWAGAFDRGGHAARLRALDAERRQGAGPALCEDLWLNAQRRAALGLYDDAIARLYRLAEAAVQARLRLRHGIADTGAIPRARVPEGIAAGGRIRHNRATRAEVVVLPLYRALDLLAHLDAGDALVACWPRDEGRLAVPEWQSLRNGSILAHGFRPASETDWKNTAAWFDERRDPLWEELLGRATAPQLPETLP